MILVFAIAFIIFIFFVNHRENDREALSASPPRPHSNSAPHIPEYSKTNILDHFGGWIHGSKESYDVLKRLGVYGPMQYNADGDGFVWSKWCNGSLIEHGPSNKELTGFDGHFSHCYVKNIEDLKQIKAGWPVLKFAVFTALDAEGKQLEPQYQTAWRMK